LACKRGQKNNTDLEELSSVVFFEVKIVHSVVWSSDTLTTKNEKQKKPVNPDTYRKFTPNF